MGIQSTDIFKTDGSPGIEYMAADETWTINAGVFVGSRDSYGVHSHGRGARSSTTATSFPAHLRACFSPAAAAA